MDFRLFSGPPKQIQIQESIQIKSTKKPKHYYEFTKEQESLFKTQCQSVLVSYSQLIQESKIPVYIFNLKFNLSFL